MRRRSRPKPYKEFSAQTGGLRPEVFPLFSLESRAAARASLQQQQERYQLIFDVPDKPLRLESSRCERQIWPDGSLFEWICLDGRASDLTETQLEEFVLQYPILADRGRNID